MKKFLALILCIVMCVSLLTITTIAANDKTAAGRKNVYNVVGETAITKDQFDSFSEIKYTSNNNLVEFPNVKFNFGFNLVSDNKNGWVFQVDSGLKGTISVAYKVGSAYYTGTIDVSKGVKIGDANGNEGINMVKIGDVNLCCAHLDYAKKTVVTPTCMSFGLQVDMCEVCCHVKLNSVKILPKDSENHVYDNGFRFFKTVKPATCKEDGLIEIYCLCCELMGTKAIDALEHDFVAGTPVAPTCTSWGYTPYECSRCDKSYKADWQKPLDHDFDEDTTNPAYYTAPTFTNDGYWTFPCLHAGCGAVKEVVDVGTQLVKPYTINADGSITINVSGDYSLSDFPTLARGRAWNTSNSSIQSGSGWTGGYLAAGTTLYNVLNQNTQ